MNVSVMDSYATRLNKLWPTKPNATYQFLLPTWDWKAQDMIELCLVHFVIILLQSSYLLIFCIASAICGQQYWSTTQILNLFLSDFLIFFKKLTMQNVGFILLSYI